MAKTKLDRFAENNPGLWKYAAIDQHDQKKSELAFKWEDKHLIFPVGNLANLLRQYSARMVDGLGTESTGFNFYFKDKIDFLEAADETDILVYDTPSIAVARYRAEHDIEKDQPGFEDAVILSILREEKPLIWKPFKVYRPSDRVMCLDAEVGRMVVEYRSQTKENSYDPSWANNYPSPESALEKAKDDPDRTKSLKEIFSLLLQEDGTYQPMFYPFFLLASKCVKAGLTKKEFEQIARMTNFRFRNKNQSGIDDRGSGSIFASLFHHEIVRGAVNSHLGISHMAGNPKQLKTIESHSADDLKNLRHEYQIKARRTIRYIWWRATEQ